MPLVSPNNGVNIPFSGDADDLVAESKRVISELDKVKASVKTNGDILEKQAKRDQENVRNSTMSWTDFRSMYQTVLDVVRVGQAVWDETGQKFADNAIEAGNLARSLGTTTEEASRLKEVADDVGISTESLKTAFKAAQKDGFEPTINGLAKMADEYNALAPGVERTQFLLDRFGKSGDEMGKLLEKGSASIREMSAAMDENLIITQKDYEAAERYRIAVDNLGDAWDGVTMQVGKKAVPAMTDLLTVMKDNIEEGFTWKSLLNGIPLYAVINKVHELKEAHEENNAATQDAITASTDASGAFESEADRAKRLADEAKAAEQAIKDLTKANQDELQTIGKLTDELDKYADKQQDIKTEHDKLIAKKNELISQGYTEESKEIREVNEQLDENIRKQQESAEEFERATNRRILARAEELASIDGLTTEEKNALIERGIAMGVYTEEAARKMREEEQAARNLAASLLSIPKNVSTTVTTNYTTNGYGYSYAPSDLQYQNRNRHATGGQFLIPMSYGNEGFPLGNGDTASGGEKITITPRGQEPPQGAGIDYKKFARVLRDTLAQVG